MKAFKILLAILFSILTVALTILTVYVGYVGYTTGGQVAQTGAVVEVTLLSLPTITSALVVWLLVDELTI